MSTTLAALVQRARQAEASASDAPEDALLEGQLANLNHQQAARSSSPRPDLRRSIAAYHVVQYGPAVAVGLAAAGAAAYFIAEPLFK